MKTLLRNLGMATAICGVVLLPGCSETPDEQAQETSDALNKIADDATDRESNTLVEWEKERNAILTDLRDLRDGIDKDLGECNTQLANKDLRSIERAKQETMKTELEKEKALVEGAIASIEGISTNANEAERNSVKVKAEETRSAVRIWWDKRKEGFDKATRQDNDHDGH